MPAAFSEPADGIAPLSDIPTIGSYTGWINRNGTPFVYVNDNERSPLVDDNVLQYAFAKLSTTDPAVPFFLTLGIQKPHLPFYLPKKYFDLYPIDEIVLPPILEADLVDVPVAFMNNRANNAGGYSGNRDFLAASADSSDNQWWLKRHLQGYYAGVSYVDDLLGQLLDSIDASPHANNTYIVLTSDHGYHFGDKNIIKKSTFWDAVSRVPLIIAGPGVPQNEVVDTPVSLIDLYPTFIELANLPPPGHTLDGYSLRPLLENPDETQWDGPGYAITGLASNEILPLNTPATTHHQHHCIRTATMRYARYATGEEELYDLNADPNEWFNLADDPNYAQEKATLRNQLETELGIVGLLPTLAANEVLYHGSFEQNTNGWLPLTPPAGAIQIISGSAPHGERYIRIPSTGNTIVYNANLKLTQGETYTLYFTARSNNPGSNLTLQIARNGEPDTTALYTFQNTLGIEWQTYSHTFTHTENTAPWNSRLVVTLTSPGIYFLDHVRVVRQAPDGLNEQRWQQAVNLFPNPAVYEPVRYQLPELPGANAYYTIHNPQGKRCREGRITTPEGVVFTEGLTAGTYFVTFYSGSYNTVRKLVLAR
jgi:arylsulfatase A-like enzyme